MKKVGSGIGMKSIKGKAGAPAGANTNARAAASKNAPNSKLGPKQGATSRGTGLGKKGR